MKDESDCLIPYQFRFAQEAENEEMGKVVDIDKTHVR